MAFGTGLWNGEQMFHATYERIVIDEHGSGWFPQPASLEVTPPKVRSDRPQTSTSSPKNYLPGEGKS